MSRDLSTDFQEEVFRRSKDGESVKTIALELDAPRATVRNALIERRVRLYKEGASLMDLAAESDVSAQAIRQSLLRRGVELRSPSHNLKPRQPRLQLPANDIIARYKTGSSLREIAEDFGVSAKAVRSVLIRNGVERRPVGWPQ